MAPIGLTPEDGREQPNHCWTIYRASVVEPGPVAANAHPGMSAIFRIPLVHGRMGIRRGPFPFSFRSCHCRLALLPRNPKTPSPLAPVPCGRVPSPSVCRLSLPGGQEAPSSSVTATGAAPAACAAAPLRPCASATVTRAAPAPLLGGVAPALLLDGAASAPLLDERDRSRPCSAARLRPAGLPSRAPARPSYWSTKCVFRAQMCISGHFLFWTTRLKARHV